MSPCASRPWSEVCPLPSHRREGQSATGRQTQHLRQRRYTARRYWQATCRVGATHRERCDPGGLHPPYDDGVGSVQHTVSGAMPVGCTHPTTTALGLSVRRRVMVQRRGWIEPDRSANRRRTLTTDPEMPRKPGARILPIAIPPPRPATLRPTSVTPKVTTARRNVTPPPHGK